VEVVALSGNLRTTLKTSAPRANTRGFTVIDVLVSMTVIAVLVGILLPSLGSVQETARRTVCQSNLRQVGFGLTSFADERKGRLPTSIFKQTPNASVAEMMTLRLGIEHPNADAKAQWDGLGLLHEGEFLLGPRVYYCPSHKGGHHFREYAAQWGLRDRTTLVGNYQYRGSSRDGTRDLFRILPARTALVSDGMRTLSDYNHIVGTNVLRADLSTGWVNDLQNGGIASMYDMAEGENAPLPGNAIEEAWARLDQAGPIR
jgi:competence protein ComGC